ncbi:MAG: protein kinase [Deltaproteobacteria bacterium]|nr:protein kinase [Deltaproteobacteria bacterium]
MASSEQQTFGKYKLERRIAFGGMAEVFLGRVHGEAGFSKSVVLKRLHPRLNEDSEFVQMLIDEARITSQLSHSNICQVLDLGAVDDSYYIAMEFIAGEDLRTLLDLFARRGEFMPVEAAIYIVSETLAGLDYAHSKEDADGESLGVIHRDVSPQNVLISYEGEVKVIDFGIAKARSRMVHTQAGVIKGKFRYMSPEQASGHPLDHRTDVFAAGVVLYELLRGRPHSQNVPDTEVLRRMREADFEPIQRGSEEVSDELLKIVARALHRKTKKRWRTAEEFRQALLGYLQGQGKIFGRTQLSGLMKDVFSLERRRERSGQTSQAKRGVAVTPDPFAPETPSGTAIQAESAVVTGRKDVSKAAYAETSARLLDKVSATSDSALSSVSTNPISSQEPVFTSARGSSSGEVERVISGEIDNSAHSSPLSAIATNEQTNCFSSGRDAASARQQSVARGPAAPPSSEQSLRATVARPPAVAATPEVYEHYPEDPRQVEDSLVVTRYAVDEPPPADAGIPLLQAPTEVAPPQHVAGVQSPRYEEQDAPPATAPTRHQRGAFSRERAKPVEAGRKLPRSRRRVDPQQIREDRPQTPAQGTGISHTEQVTRSQGRGLTNALLLLILIGGIGAGAFYAGRSYLGKPGAGHAQAKDLAFAVTPDLSSQPDASPKRERRPSLVRLRVTSSPRGAAIRLCGRDTGKVTPATIRQRPKKRCKLVLTLAGYESYSTSVLLRKKRIKINATLRPQRQGLAQGVGELTVTSIQVGIVTINGQKVGRTPGLRLSLRPGRYRVKVSFPSLGTTSRSKLITIYEGRSSKLHFDPE